MTDDEFWDMRPAKFMSCVTEAFEYENAKWGGSKESGKQKQARNPEVVVDGCIDQIDGW